MAEETVQKWEGKVMVELKSSTAEQIWPFLAEFCNLDKLFPSVDTCYLKEGTRGQPGLVRYCEGKAGWVNEKLLTIDPINHLLSYEVMENNIGLKSYVAAFKILPMKLEGDGCKIEWSFISDPIEGMKLEDFVSYLDNTLQFMAKKMEDAVYEKKVDVENFD